MKVYVATKGYENEGSYVLGVFKTKDGAQECCDKSNGAPDAIYEVEEFELEE